MRLESIEPGRGRPDYRYAVSDDGILGFCFSPDLGREERFLRVSRVDTTRHFLDKFFTVSSGRVASFGLGARL